MVGTSFDTATLALCTRKITDAENEVNKYLSKRYDISAFQTSVPPLVTSLTDQLTEGYMYRSMARGGKDALAHAKSLIDPVLANLLMIAEFKADVLDSSGDPIADSGNGSYQILSTTSEYSNTFNEDSELNWVVDPDKLTDIESERG